MSVVCGEASGLQWGIEYPRDGSTPRRRATIAMFSGKALHSSKEYLKISK